jgi:hypothetical protein
MVTDFREGGPCDGEGKQAAELLSAQVKVEQLFREVESPGLISAPIAGHLYVHPR